MGARNNNQTFTARYATFDGTQKQSLLSLSFVPSVSLYQSRRPFKRSIAGPKLSNEIFIETFCDPSFGLTRNQCQMVFNELKSTGFAGEDDTFSVQTLLHLLRQLHISDILIFNRDMRHLNATLRSMFALFPNRFGLFDLLYTLIQVFKPFFFSRRCFHERARKEIPSPELRSKMSTQVRCLSAYKRKKWPKNHRYCRLEIDVKTSSFTYTAVCGICSGTCML